MANNIDLIKATYNEKLKAKKYNNKFNQLFPMIKDMFDLMFQFLSDVVESGMFKGSKVLEIGSGATVHGIASASGQYSCIVQSDYVLDNCEELRRWHRGESSLDWTQFLDAALKIEQKKGKSPISLAELKARIRSNVRCVVRSDVLSDTVLQTSDLTTDTTPPYDLVITLLCLEAAAHDEESYGAVIKRIHGLIRTGGGLVVCGFENGSTWAVEGDTFHHVRLSMAQITRALEEAGFKVRELKTLPKIETVEDDYDYDSFFCVAAQKR